MLRFELRVVEADGDGEILVSDYVTIDPSSIDQFGGCESVDHAVAAALRAVKRDLARREMEAA